MHGDDSSQQERTIERIIYSVNCDRLARPGGTCSFLPCMIERPAARSHAPCSRHSTTTQPRSRTGTKHTDIRRHRAWPQLLLGEESTHACMAADAAPVHMHGACSKPLDSGVAVACSGPVGGVLLDGKPPAPAHRDLWGPAGPGPCQC